MARELQGMLRGISSTFNGKGYAHIFKPAEHHTKKRPPEGSRFSLYIHIVSIFRYLFFTGAALGQSGRDLRLLLAHNVVLKHGEDGQQCQHARQGGISKEDNILRLGGKSTGAQSVIITGHLHKDQTHGGTSARHTLMVKVRME